MRVLIFSFDNPNFNLFPFLLKEMKIKRGTVPFSTPFPCSINPTLDVEMTMRKLRLRGMSNAYETYGS
jgi:hypothetical protein